MEREMKLEIEELEELIAPAALGRGLSMVGVTIGASTVPVVLGPPDVDPVTLPLAV